MAFEVAHRYGQELLLWDSWVPDTNAIGKDIGDDPEYIDLIADLLIQADAGDQAAEEDLAHRFATDGRLRPSDKITQFSPYGNPPVTVDLST